MATTQTLVYTPELSGHNLTENKDGDIFPLSSPHPRSENGRKLQQNWFLTLLTSDRSSVIELVSMLESTEVIFSVENRPIC